MGFRGVDFRDKAWSRTTICCQDMCRLKQGFSRALDPAARSFVDWLTLSMPDGDNVKLARDMTFV